MIYQHYSFDLWLTLIRSNPAFKRERAKYFQQHYNPFSKSLEEVEGIFRTVDVMMDKANEASGETESAEVMYLTVIVMLHDRKITEEELEKIDTVALYQQMETLVMAYMPVLYDEHTTDVLAYLKNEHACTISLLSNTGFIKGSTIRKVLNHLGIGQYFDFQLYSDETGFFKPNPAFFQLMLDEIKSLKQIPLNEIIHIGDNPLADIFGAGQVGINSLLINSNDTSILKLIPDAAQHVFTA